jgi:chromosome segregation ATPase
LSEEKPPEDKDALIQHLMERLEKAQDAITVAEEVIEHERQNRKAMSKELKQKNAELREIVEKEKKSLSDKVHEELEKTLQ